MIIGVTGLGKATGVTTLASMVAWSFAQRETANVNGSSSGRRVVLCELDPTGGDLAGWWSIPTKGVATLAGNLRARVAIGQATTAAGTKIRGGVWVVATNAVGVSVVAANHALRGAEADAEVVVVCDFGRWNPDERYADRVQAAEKVVALVPNELAGIERAKAGLEWLHDSREGIIVAQRKRGPYRPKDTAQALGVPVVAIGDDGKTADAVKEQKVNPKRSGLVRSVLKLVDDLEAGRG